ncbi:MAG: hypothetical protein KDI48_20410, partial [Xanthomonadales bacterium]|nr:hypothetical protein [Xanthomonadales bacterium]
HQQAHTSTESLQPRSSSDWKVNTGIANQPCRIGPAVFLSPDKAMCGIPCFHIPKIEYVVNITRTPSARVSS